MTADLNADIELHIVIAFDCFNRLHAAEVRRCIEQWLNDEFDAVFLLRLRGRVQSAGCVDARRLPGFAAARLSHEVDVLGNLESLRRSRGSVRRLRRVGAPRGNARRRHRAAERSTPVSKILSSVAVYDGAELAGSVIERADGTRSRPSTPATDRSDASRVSSRRREQFRHRHRQWRRSGRQCRLHVGDIDDRRRRTASG